MDSNGDDNGTTSVTFQDDTINTDGAVGFYGSLGSLTLVTLSNDNKTPTDKTDDVNYLGLQLSALTAKLVGFDNLTFGVWDAAVKVNSVKAGTAVTPVPSKIDWTGFNETADSLAVPSLDVTAGVDSRPKAVWP